MSDEPSCNLANAVGDFLGLNMNGRMSLVSVLELDPEFKRTVEEWCGEKLRTLRCWENHWGWFVYVWIYRRTLRALFLFVQWYASVQRRRRRKQRGDDCDTQQVLIDLQKWNSERAVREEGFEDKVMDETENVAMTVERPEKTNG